MEETIALMKTITSKFDNIKVINSIGIINLQDQIKNNEIYLIDVRTKSEQQISMIPNAITQNNFENLNWNDELKNKMIISYCTIGYRSGIYSQYLVKNGFTNVYNGEGILLWTHHSNEVINNKIGKTNVVHTFSSKYSHSISNKYQSTYFNSFQLFFYMIYIWFIMNKYK